MKFKKGETVEVFSKRGGLTFSWWTAKIVSSNGATHIVSYNHKLDEDLGVNLEQVSAQAVRPFPPPIYELTWVVGDIVDVFDDHSWKLAAILKIVHKRCIIRFIGSDEVREVNSNDIRIRLSWENEEWLVIKQEFGKTKLCVPMDKAADCHMVVEDEMIPSPKRQHTRMFADVWNETISSDEEVAADELLKNSTTGIKYGRYVNAISEPNDRESVGSCDIGDSCAAGDGSSSKISYVTPSVQNDSCFCVGESSEEIHNGELHAYRRTLVSLYESGPISWDQEALITNLRLTLHISNDEHLEEVKKLMSAENHFTLGEGPCLEVISLLLKLRATSCAV